MKIGYARVSTQDQELGRQLEALQKAGCEKIFQDKISGSKSSRPQLNAMMDELKEGDVVVVQALDRLGRSLKHLIEIVDKFNDMGVEFISINNGFDTTTINGKMLFYIVGAMAETERAIIRERVQNGIDFTRKKEEYVSGEKKWGRPEVDMFVHGKVIHMSIMEGMSVSDIAEKLELSRPTVYKILKTLSV